MKIISRKLTLKDVSKQAWRATLKLDFGGGQYANMRFSLDKSAPMARLPGAEKTPPSISRIEAELLRTLKEALADS
ncbi:MAG: hypothetical protein LBH10_05135 [Burkholderiaceae bacterium]|jgi:hypothetical protein|nr:hypothetical protein [Burkholderiaceae bacterium]